MARNWEYKVKLPPVAEEQDYPYIKLEDLEDWLNELDNEGWELYGYNRSNIIDRSGVQHFWIFRRLVPVAP